jgi:hypothetical protein
MPITIAGYSFAGPYSSTNSLEDRSGVYAILCKKDNGNYSLVDVGESATVKSRVETHDRKACWSRNCNSLLTVAVLYTPHLQQSGRLDIEQKIRAQYNLPCGDR